MYFYNILNMNIYFYYRKGNIYCSFNDLLKFGKRKYKYICYLYRENY